MTPETSAFIDLLERFSAAVARRDIPAFTALFTAEAYYDDVFYGRHEGRAAIGAMLEKFFRDGDDFVWEMREPVCAGNIGYAQWAFSFTSRKPATDGRRVLMIGASRYRLQDGLIAAYDEYCYQASALLGIGTPLAALEKALLRQDAAFRNRVDRERHRLPPQQA